MSGNRLPYWDIPQGDHLWAFRLSGTVAQGADVKNTVTLGRIWNTESKRPGAEENLLAENARCRVSQRYYLAR